MKKTYYGRLAGVLCQMHLTSFGYPKGFFVQENTWTGSFVKHAAFMI